MFDISAATFSAIAEWLSLVEHMTLCESSTVAGAIELVTWDEIARGRTSSDTLDRNIASVLAVAKVICLRGADDVARLTERELGELRSVRTGAWKNLEFADERPKPPRIGQTAGGLLRACDADWFEEAAAGARCFAYVQAYLFRWGSEYHRRLGSTGWSTRPECLDKMSRLGSVHRLMYGNAPRDIAGLALGDNVKTPLAALDAALAELIRRGPDGAGIQWEMIKLAETLRRASEGEDADQARRKMALSDYLLVGSQRWLTMVPRGPHPRARRESSLKVIVEDEPEVFEHLASIYEGIRKVWRVNSGGREQDQVMRAHGVLSSTVPEVLRLQRSGEAVPEATKARLFDELTSEMSSRDVGQAGEMMMGLTQWRAKLGGCQRVTIKSGSRAGSNIAVFRLDVLGSGTGSEWQALRQP